MSQALVRQVLLAAFVGVAGVSPAVAQSLPVPEVRLASQSSSAPAQGEIHGTVHDERGDPVAGAVVSVLGATSVFAVSDAQGRYTLRSVPPGPYLVRAYLQGYLSPRGRVVQITPAARTASNLTLTRRAPADGSGRVLAAGVGPAADAAGDEDAAAEGPVPAHGHDEVAWRLRHLKRNVLKEATAASVPLGDDEASLLGESLSNVGRAVSGSARLASTFFSDLPELSGQINLLASTSFHRPQDLFSIDAGAPRSTAYLALTSPSAGGEWAIRGTLTQGDLASWILAGSYVRRGPVAHRYEAGVSYSMQRYFGGNAEALAATADGTRNVGAIYAYDSWTVNPRVVVAYGARYASYGYLADQHLLSPRATLTVSPIAGDALRVHTTIWRRETAPGEEEFVPPSTGLWLPPERTFSTISYGPFRPERLDHVEVGAERELAGVALGVRVFRQRIQDQIATLFGVSPVDTPAPVGHYHVAAVGDVEARGWGVTVARDVGDGLRASVDYTHMDARHERRSREALLLLPLAASLVRDEERVYDLTATVQQIVDATATRVYVAYKVSNGFAASTPGAPAGFNGRFDVQVNQGLPFLDFTSARWEMLVAVRNLFREELREGSLYDELLVVRPPKRVLGGVTVRF